MIVHSILRVGQDANITSLLLSAPAVPTGSISCNGKSSELQPCLQLALIGSECQLALTESELGCLSAPGVTGLSQTEGQVVSDFCHRLDDFMSKLMVAFQAEPNYEEFLNRWIKIPNWPGYCVLFKQMPEGTEDSQLPLMYPGLLRRNVQLWFHSAWDMPTCVRAGGK